jgi:hypothetical protein
MRWLALLALLGGCTAEDVGEPVVSREERTDFPIHIDRDLDVLFVVDDSPSMADEQVALAAGFERIIAALETIEGGLPNLHIAVVSGDGSGAFVVGDGCSPDGVRFLVDVAERDGSRIRNYDGALVDAFTCNAMVGSGGSEPQQPLEAMRRALDGSNPDNAGFRRDGAHLAIVLVSDEDDCSNLDPSRYAADPFACFEDGVLCGPDGCVPREDSPTVQRVSDYVDFLKSLVIDDSLVLVSTITGPAEPVVVGSDHLEPSCASATGLAYPAIRLDHFRRQFPNRNSATSICGPDLSEGFSLFAELSRMTLGAPCLSGRLHDLDPDTDGIQFECVVSEVVAPDTNEQEETLLPYCSDLDPVVPCWRLVEDLAACPDTPTHLILGFERGGASVTNTYVRARCRTE